MPKPVRWAGSSREDLREFPEEVRRAVGIALRLALASWRSWRTLNMADIRKIAVSDEPGIRITEGSANVFEDLGLPDAEEELAKAGCAMLIYDAIKERGLSQRQAAKILGLDQANISRLMNGRLSGFSLDRLFRLLNALDMDVEVTVRKKPDRQGHGVLLVRAVA